MKYSIGIFLVVLLVIIDATGSEESDAKTKRDVNKKFGFFGGIFQIGRLAYQQYSDTTSTLQKMLDLLQDNFSDTATKPPKGASTASPENETGETTTEKYRVSRQELARILGRNYRGLQKLLRLEINDALNQTKYNIADYKKEYHESIKKSKESLTTTPSSE